VALAVPLPGVLAEAAVDEQEVALRLVLGQSFAGLAVDLYIHEQDLLPTLAVRREGPVRGESQVGDSSPAREVLQLGVGGEPAGQRRTIEVGHSRSPWPGAPI